MLLGTLWGTLELSLHIAGGRAFIQRRPWVVSCPSSSRNWMFTSNFRWPESSRHLTNQLLLCCACPPLPAPELFSAGVSRPSLPPVLLCSLCGNFLFSLPGIFPFFPLGRHLLGSILVVLTSTHPHWAHRFMEWFQLLLLWCQLQNPHPQPSLLSSTGINLFIQPTNIYQEIFLFPFGHTERFVGSLFPD